MQRGTGRKLPSNCRQDQELRQSDCPWLFAKDAKAADFFERSTAVPFTRDA